MPQPLPSAHIDPEASTSVPSPRAPLKKKARTGAAGKQEVPAGSLLTPFFDNVSCFLLFVVLFCLLEQFSTWYYISLFVDFFAALDEGDG
jgi:hypothetical protein